MRRVACALVVLCSATACAFQQRPDAGVTFVVVRHAEKATDDPRDPSLSTAGTVRAHALAQLLHSPPVSAAYATRFRRTRLTAAPIAHAAGIRVTTYDADLPVDAFVRQLRETHADGAVLVVGHSNTVPLIAAGLGVAAKPIPDCAYDRMLVVTLGTRPSAIASRYGAPSENCPG